MSCRKAATVLPKISIELKQWREWKEQGEILRDDLSHWKFFLCSLMRLYNVVISTWWCSVFVAHVDRVGFQIKSVPQSFVLFIYLIYLLTHPPYKSAGLSIARTPLTRSCSSSLFGTTALIKRLKLGHSSHDFKFWFATPNLSLPPHLPCVNILETSLCSNNRFLF